jgi:hypothetical protein
VLSYDAFRKCMEGYERYRPAKHIVAICDYSRTSSIRSDLS